MGPRPWCPAALMEPSQSGTCMPRRPGMWGTPLEALFGAWLLSQSLKHRKARRSTSVCISGLEAPSPSSPELTKSLHASQLVGHVWHGLQRVAARVVRHAL